MDVNDYRQHYVVSFKDNTGRFKDHLVVRTSEKRAEMMFANGYMLSFIAEMLKDRMNAGSSKCGYIDFSPTPFFSK